MNLIIGVLGRPKTSDRDFTSFSKAITDVILKYNNIPLGIIPPIINVNREMNENDIAKLQIMLDLCDGVILQGGTDYYQYDMEAIKYIYEKRIPLLGICLGMQSMGVYGGASMAKVPNHSKTGVKYVHKVDLEVTSKLKNIIGKDKISVNSRHNEMIVNPNNIEVAGYSDNVIEVVEKADRDFFVGVQWHPEDMLEYDSDAPKIFNALFNASQEYHLKRNKI